MRKRCEICSKLKIKTPEQRYDLEIEETEIFNIVNVQLNRRKKNAANIYLSKAVRETVEKRVNYVESYQLCRKMPE